MKKSILMGIFALFTITGNAQLKVLPNGIVQANRIQINGLDSVFWSTHYGLYSETLGDSLANVVSISGHAYANDTPAYAPTNVIGLRGEAEGGFYSYGVKGTAIGLASYGVYGNVPPVDYGVNYGAAIYGTTKNSSVVLDDSYAGYFDGTVKIVDGLWVTGYGIYGTLYGRSLTNNASLMGSGSIKAAEVNAVSEKLAKLQIGTFQESSLTNKDTEKRTEGSLEEYKIGKENDTRIHYGLSADQLQEEFPDLVLESIDGEKYINYVEMVPLLVQSIKELSAEVTTLKEQLGIQDPSKPVMKVKEQTTAIEETETDVVTMSQNKPNPFSDSSVITLNIPETTKSAVIGIYDMSGKQVQAINVPQRGQTDITVFAAGLTPGMYVYNLIVDGKVQVSRKMIVQHL